MRQVFSVLLPLQVTVGSPEFSCHDLFDAVWPLLRVARPGVMVWLKRGSVHDSGMSATPDGGGSVTGGSVGGSTGPASSRATTRSVRSATLVVRSAICVSIWAPGPVALSAIARFLFDEVP